LKYTLKVNDDIGIIEAKSTGEWTVPDSDKVTTNIVEKAEETGIVKILIDHSELDINVTSMIAYRRPLELKSKFEHITPKVVFVCPEGRYKLYRFFITVAKKRGILFEVTRDYDSAVAWLQKD